MTMDEYKDIPPDGWAFRLARWEAASGEEMVGKWHRTRFWFRRDGVFSGLMAECGRIHTPLYLELVGAPDQHPLGELCLECFGLHHSDELLQEAQP